MPVYVKGYIIYRIMNVLILGKKPTKNGIIFLAKKEVRANFFFFHDVMKIKEVSSNFFFGQKWSSSMISVKIVKNTEMIVDLVFFEMRGLPIPLQ